MTDEEAAELLKHRHVKPWLWITIVVLATAAGGATGLYTGSASMERVKDAQAKEEADRHTLELNNVNQQVGVLAANLKALTDKVHGVEQTATTAAIKATDTANKVDQVASTVSDVSAKVDQRAALGDRTHAIATTALKKSQLNEAKADVALAKADIAEQKAAVAASMVKVPAPPPAPIQLAPKEGHGWWSWGNGH
jgi:flagellar biosynthesis chaperone FliJ